MNFKIFAATLLFFAVNSFAENVSTTKTPKATFESEVSGLRASVLAYKPNAEYLYKGKKFWSDDFSEAAPGIGIGYAYSPMTGLGYDGRLTLAELKIKGDGSTFSEDILRLEGNGSYSFNKNFLTKAGLNYTKFVGSYGSSSYNGAVGAQIGMNYQFNSQFGADIQYLVSRITTKEDSDSEYRFSGLEVGLHTTF